MTWVKFTAFFNWRIGNSGSSRDYQAGEVVNVTRACAKRAIDAGRAVAMVKTHRDAEPREKEFSDV